MSVIGMTPMTCRMCSSIRRDKDKKYFSKTARCELVFFSFAEMQHILYKISVFLSIHPHLFLSFFVHFAYHPQEMRVTCQRHDSSRRYYCQELMELEN